MIMDAAPPGLERRCPFTAYLEFDRGPEPPRVHRLETDICVVGSGPDCDLVLAPAAEVPLRAGVIVRGWSGFAALALGRSVERNGVPLARRATLRSRDTLRFGSQSCRFFVSQAEAAP
jgi:hypothetical protein